MHPNTYISAVTTFYGADKRDNCFAWATSVLPYLASAISCCKTWMTRWLLAHKNRSHAMNMDGKMVLCGNTRLHDTLRQYKADVDGQLDCL